MNREFGDVVRRIKESADIVGIVGNVVQLKKAGNSYKGRCPFHNEKTPSFNVVPAKGIFHCFGCGAGGSVIDFVMRTEKLDFREAIERLAKELGIELPQFRPVDPQQVDADQRLVDAVQRANNDALAWFRQNLRKGRNPLANSYLPERGISAEMEEKFQLGASLDEWTALKDHLLNLGYSEQLLVEAGLCARSENGRVYDRFRNRLIFPIFNANGKVAGFGGRQLVKDDKSAKYINSEETVLYKKSQILYALNWAREDIEKSGHAILCEGYMDVLMAHAHGFTQAVASLGTALTLPQAKLLKRFANKTFFLYDGDTAGQKAMIRGGESLLEAGFDTRVIALPPTDDPDTFLQREGAPALQQLLQNAEEFFDYALGAHAKGLDLSKLAPQAELADRMAPIINRISNEVMREGAIARLLRRIGGLPRSALGRILQQAANAANRTEPESRPAESAADRAVSSLFEGISLLDVYVLKMMLESHAALEYIRSQLRHEWIIDKKLEGWIFYFSDHDGYAQTLIDEAELENEFPGDRALLSRVMAWDHPIGDNPVRAAEQILWRLRERYQLVLTNDLLELISQKQIGSEDAQRLLTAYHLEHRSRIAQSRRLFGLDNQQASQPSE
ncbi:MAG TPA: DNA primase [Candidatus Sumerlaeota bacterium]|nr:DNA primase [Candidatus Sumerlaeota bacterium]